MSYAPTTKSLQKLGVSARQQPSRQYSVDRLILSITLGTLVVVLPSMYFWYRHQLRHTSDALFTRAEKLQQEGDLAQAAAYYQRNLSLNPGNTPALVQLVEIVAQQDPTPERLSRFSSLLYQSIGRAPERNDFRRMLAETLLKLGAVEEAEKQAKWLLENAPEEARLARKVIALSLAARSRTDGSISISQVASALISAAEESPGDAQLIGVAANTLREHSTAIELANGSAITVADRLMDQLVASDPNNVDARLTRYRYRMKYALPDTNGDLDAALELEPDNVNAILLSAFSVLADTSTKKDRSHAESLLRHAIEVAPRDPRAYLILTGIFVQSDRHGEALALLERGRRETSNNFDIGLVYANVQVDIGNLEAAKETLRGLDSQASTHLVQLEGDARIQIENRLQLLRSRIDHAQGNPQLAIPRLHTILLSAEAASSGQRSPEWLEASRMLAQIHATAGRWDKASEYWGSLARELPGDELTVRHAVDSYLRTSNAKEAVKTIEEFFGRAEPSSELLVQRVQAHLALQLSRPIAERDWTVFERALDEAKQVAADRAELVFAEANRIATAADDRPAAAALLRASEKKFSNEVAFWRSATQLYQELGQMEDVERAFAKHRELSDSARDNAILESSLLAGTGKYQQADQVLSALGQLPELHERKEIERLRVEVLTEGDDLAGALKRVRQLIEDDPRDAGSLAMGIDVALGAGELQSAAIWGSMLSELSDSGAEVRYWQNRQFLQSYERLPGREQQDVGRSISDLRTERPMWYPAVALASRYAQLQGDLRRALADYRLAVELGDRRQGTLKQVVTLLYKYGRFDEAQNYLSYLTSHQSSGQFSDTMAVELAVKQGRADLAIELAKQSVERFSDDAMRRILLADLLLRYGKPQDGVEVLREAARDFPDDSRVWLGLVSAFVQAGQSDEARETLTHLTNSSVLSQEQRYQVAAQGYELVGDIQSARESYELAIEHDPEDTAVQLLYARLLSRSDPRAARSQYEHVLQHDPANADARRELAVLLAATRRESDWTRATQLLASAGDDSTGDPNTDFRLRALLLSQKGRTRAERISNCQMAKQILQPLIDLKTGSTDELNHLLMAQILEREAELSEDKSLLFEAQVHLRTVANRAPPSAEWLSRYIEFLLRHGGVRSVDSNEDSASRRSNSDIAEQKEVFLAEAEAKISDLRKLISAGDRELAALTVAFQASLVKARGRESEAKAIVSEYVAHEVEANQDQDSQARRYLTAGKLYTSIGLHAEAEVWYRRLMDLSPSSYVPVVQSLLAQDKQQEAIELCLKISKDKLTPEIATLLARVTTIAEEPAAEISEVQTAIETAMEDHGGDVELLQAEAVRKASSGRYADAVAIFRRVLEIDPDNALTLNNLATILAEAPASREEALELIQQAIEIAGRQSALLDTQGTIFLDAGNVEQAILCLEEATAGGAPDARFYLHLAAAYHRAQRDDDALRMLTESHEFGLKNTILTESDRKLLALLNEQLQPLASTAGTTL